MEYTYDKLIQEQNNNFYKSAMEKEFDDVDEVNSDNSNPVNSSHSSICESSDKSHVSMQFMSRYNGTLDLGQVEKQFERITNLANSKANFKKVKQIVRRCDAQNKFKYETVEFNVLENIDKHETRVKDKVSIYYKKVDSYILDQEGEFSMKMNY